MIIDKTQMFLMVKHKNDLVARKNRAYNVLIRLEEKKADSDGFYTYHRKKYTNSQYHCMLKQALINHETLKLSVLDFTETYGKHLKRMFKELKFNPIYEMPGRIRCLYDITNGRYIHKAEIDKISDDIDFERIFLLEDNDKLVYTTDFKERYSVQRTVKDMRREYDKKNNDTN